MKRDCFRFPNLWMPSKAVPFELTPTSSGTDCKRGRRPCLQEMWSCRATFIDRTNIKEVSHFHFIFSMCEVFGLLSSGQAIALREPVPTWEQYDNASKRIWTRSRPSGLKLFDFGTRGRWSLLQRIWTRYFLKIPGRRKARLPRSSIWIPETGSRVFSASCRGECDLWDSPFGWRLGRS